MNRRVKTLHVSQELIAHVLFGDGDEAPLGKIFATGLPQGYVVECVETNHRRGAIVFYISHPSFPEMMPGCDLVELDVRMRVEYPPLANFPRQHNGVLQEL
jgi:hypothetical protein